MAIETVIINGRNLFASLWIPDHAFADEKGQLLPEFLWGALDCPGGWSLVVQLWPQLVLLGKMSAQIKRPVLAGQAYMVMGWHIKSEGRKHETGTAVLTAAGELSATGKATWITLRSATAP
jgi:hypothetical protein